MALGRNVLTWFEGRWHAGNLAVMGAADHGTWQGTLVFDGARAFEGVTPDLDLHCARLIRSAAVMGMDPVLEAAAIEALVRDGIRRLGSERALYLRPMMWSREASPALIDALPGSTALAVCLEDLPLREPGPLALTVSPFRRPSPDSALSEAKAACHYPNNARIIREARGRGFQNALSLDQAGQRRRDRLDQRLPGARRGGDDAGGERHLPRRDHPAPGDRVAARRRGRGGRDGTGGGGFRGGGGDLPDRQREQGDAGHPLRGARARIRAGGGTGPGALLGLCAPGPEGGVIAGPAAKAAGGSGASAARGFRRSARAAGEMSAWVLAETGRFCWRGA